MKTGSTLPYPLATVHVRSRITFVSPFCPLRHKCDGVSASNDTREPGRKGQMWLVCLRLHPALPPRSPSVTTQTL